MQRQHQDTMVGKAGLASSSGASVQTNHSTAPSFIGAVILCNQEPARMKEKLGAHLLGLQSIKELSSPKKVLNAIFFNQN